MLTATQNEWDNKTLNYDLEKFNWPERALSVIQEVSRESEDLYEFCSS